MESTTFVKATKIAPTEFGEPNDGFPDPLRTAYSMTWLITILTRSVSLTVIGPD